MQHVEADFTQIEYTYKIYHIKIANQSFIHYISSIFNFKMKKQ